MNRNNMISHLHLTDEVLGEIEQSVKDAEKTTSGEISLAITSQSSTYAFWELLWAVVTTVILLVCIIPLSAQIYNWLDLVFWGARPWYLAAFFVIVCIVMMCCIYFLYNVPAIDYMIIPQSAKNEAVNNRAMEWFTSSGVYLTKEHNGILIFVSVLERQVRIIADRGINAKVSQDLWNLVADEMTEKLAQNDVKGAFTGAVKRCGELLAENYPHADDDVNELSDKLAVLEDVKWV